MTNSTSGLYIISYCVTVCSKKDKLQDNLYYLQNEIYDMDPFVRHLMSAMHFSLFM